MDFKTFASTVPIIPFSRRRRQSVTGLSVRGMPRFGSFDSHRRQEDAAAQLESGEGSGRKPSMVRSQTLHRVRRDWQSVPPQVFDQNVRAWRALSLLWWRAEKNGDVRMRWFMPALEMVCLTAQLAYWIWYSVVSWALLPCLAGIAFCCAVTLLALTARQTMLLCHPGLGVLVQLSARVEVPPRRRRRMRLRLAVLRLLGLSQFLYFAFFLPYLRSFTPLRTVIDNVPPAVFWAAAGQPPTRWEVFLADTVMLFTNAVLFTQLFDYLFALSAGADFVHAIVDEFKDAVCNTNPSAQEDWEARVGPLVHALQADLLAPLSDWFATGFSSLTGSLVAMSFAMLCIAANASHPHLDGWQFSMEANLVLYQLFIVLLISAVPATLTTSVGGLIEELNALRVTRSQSSRGFASTEVNDRVNTLVHYLRNLNNGQGPGFVVQVPFLDAVVISAQWLVRSGTQLYALLFVALKFLVPAAITPAAAATTTTT